jgi:hypothetical protein
MHAARTLNVAVHALYRVTVLGNDGVLRVLFHVEPVLLCVTRKLSALFF